MVFMGHCLHVIVFTSQDKGILGVLYLLWRSQRQLFKAHWLVGGMARSCRFISPILSFSDFSPTPINVLIGGQVNKY